MLDSNASVLLIYTGGTIGMVEDVNGALIPLDFTALREFVPELKRFQFWIDTIQFEKPVDSSDMNPEKWSKLVRIIQENYARYDGFVILHGTDTMAYSASALSFMLENIDKPVILTGSQLPIGKIRTDGRENLLTALEMAVDKAPDGKPIVTEVCIFFQDLLMRGNRTTKINAANFKAFNSFNFPVLAEAGTKIRYRYDLMHRPLPHSTPKFHYTLDPKVAIVKIFPGMSADVLKANSAILHLKAIVLETYGAGDAPGDQWFLDIVDEWIKKGIVVLNVSQCASGSVNMDLYQAGKSLQEIGVLSGYDITTEAAVAKLMFLFGLGLTRHEVKIALKMSIVGEITVD
ncbi:L-asparaginase 1 [Bacteroidia bacterium]|nr:L-asparaginase 1 [Bacteroidia bacterium]